MNPADPYIVDFIADINRARVLRARTVMKKGSEPLAGVVEHVDANDTLEMVIAKARGDTERAFRVMRGAKQIGTLTMRDVVLALVPTDASDEGARRAS